VIRRPPRSTQGRSSAASDVYKRQLETFSQCLIEFLVLREPGSILATFLLIRLVVLDQLHPSGRVNARRVGSEARRPICCAFVHQRAPDGRPEVVRQHLTPDAVSYTHLRAHETRHDLVCRLLLEKKKKKQE